MRRTLEACKNVTMLHNFPWQMVGFISFYENVGNPAEASFSAQSVEDDLHFATVTWSCFQGWGFVPPIVLIEHRPIAGDLGDFRYFHVYIYIPLCMYIYTLYIYVSYIMICHRNIHANHSCFSDTSDLARSLDFRMLPRQIAQGSNPTSPWCSIPIHIWGFHSLGGTPIAGWFIWWNILLKWMIQGNSHDVGTPHMATS